MGFAFCAIKHLLSIQKVHWKPSIIYGCACCAVMITQILLMLFRNKQLGKPWPRLAAMKNDGHMRALLQLSRPIQVEAGQYINIWVPSVSFFSSHPFTVSSWSPKPQTEIELWIAKRGGFTSRLYRRADHIPRRALFTGPHGRSPSLRRFEQVLIFATGFGTVAVLPYLQQLIYHSKQGLCKTKRVRFIWHVHSLSSL